MGRWRRFLFIDDKLFFVDLPLGTNSVLFSLVRPSVVMRKYVPYEFMMILPKKNISLLLYREGKKFLSSPLARKPFKWQWVSEDDLGPNFSFYGKDGLKFQCCFRVRLQVDLRFKLHVWLLISSALASRLNILSPRVTAPKCACKSTWDSKSTCKWFQVHLQVDLIF